MADEDLQATDAAGGGGAGHQASDVHLDQDALQTIFDNVDDLVKNCEDCAKRCELLRDLLPIPKGPDRVLNDFADGIVAIVPKKIRAAMTNSTRAARVAEEIKGLLPNERYPVDDMAKANVLQLKLEKLRACDHAAAVHEAEACELADIIIALKDSVQGV